MVTGVVFIPKEEVKSDKVHMDMFDQQHVRKLIERYGDDYEVGYCYLECNW